MNNEKTVNIGDILKDSVTKLPRQELILDRLYRTLAYSKRYHFTPAVCYMRTSFPDEVLLDSNDETVHTIKKIMAERFSQCIRDIDSVGVINRTDFLFFLTDVNVKECNQIIERIIDLLSGTYTIGHASVTIGVNIGVCMYPYDSSELEKLIDMSKMQMFESSAYGLNNYAIYQGDVNEDSYRKAIIEHDIFHAIRDEQFELTYQVQVDTYSLEVTGVESLIRWNHPRVGVVSPDEFIPLAENTGIANDIFFWVLDKVCLQLHADDGLPRDLTYAINLSVNQLLLPTFNQQVQSILKKHNVQPNRIRLEITENVMIYKYEKVKEKLQMLQNEGITVALDDFGYGYFSFSDLIHLPISTIKFDKRLMNSLDHDNKLHTVISPLIEMAHNLGLVVIVEGVETAEQYNTWKQMNSDVIQGFLFGKPVKPDQLMENIELVRKWKGQL